ncbi:MAG: cytochrome C oxidase subunit IV family protein [Planctomycetales bacterium]
MSEQPTTSDTPEESGAHDDHPHGGSIKTYMLVFIALCVLTSASFLTYTDFWRNSFDKHTGWAFMMAVSCTKAMLVILFFMHLLYEANWKYVLTLPSIFMSVFLVCMLIPDVGMRMNWASDERKRHMAVEKPQESDHSGQSSNANAVPAGGH